MRTTFRFFAIALGIFAGVPAWAQMDQSQQQSITAPAVSQEQQIPAIPSLQDIRSPLTTITNRPRSAAAAGAQTGAAAGEDLEAQQRERNEFQQFVMQSTGRDLPIFGANLFRSVPSTFAPVENVPVMSDYVIGPGDEIQIRAWGQIDVDYNATVDGDGTISVPKVGVINVAGIKASDLPAYLKTVFGRTFRNFQLTATLGRLRSIQVYVV